jgi:hypothetical protein
LSCLVATMTPKQPYIVQVRFCGGCNPEIDRRALLERLQHLNASHLTRLCFTTVGGAADMLLKINGCAHACLDEADCSATDAPTSLSVQGCALDRRVVPEIHLPEAVLERIRAFVNHSQQPTRPAE